MINKGVRLTAGLLVAALLATTIPTETFEAKSTESSDYITGTSYNFSAGAHSAIAETVVLENITDDTLYAGVEENNAPTVADPANPYANIAITNVKEYLSIRAAADKNAEALGKLYPKCAATVLETLDGWYKVTSGSVTGYVMAEYMIVGDEATCLAAAKRTAKVNVNSLRLRKEASTDAGVHTVLGTGSKLTVLDESIPGWVKVQYKSYTGYVSADYVTVETTYNYAESKEEEAARKAAANKNNNSSSNKHYNAPAGTNGQSVIDYGMQFLGTRYKWAGESLTNGVDCSGFVMKVYEAFGVSLPHSSRSLRTVGYAVSEADAKPGDILCYSGHAAIYMGNGKILHSVRGDGVKVSNNWKYKKILAIRRIF